MQIKTLCTRDCPDACGIVATVEDGRAVRLRGDADHPVTRGFLCWRTNRFLDRQYATDRLMTPLVRRDGALQQATWDEALGLVADTLLRVRAESGPSAILHYRSGGSLGLVKHLPDLFWDAFGPVATKSGDICSGAGDAAQLRDFGEEDSHDVFDLLASRHIVLWGKNPHTSAIHLVPILEEARSRGARILLIDPVRHKGERLADRVIQPRPGATPALALGVGRALFDGGHVRAEALARCDNAEAFRGLCEARTVAGWAAMADVTVEDVRAIAGALGDGPTNIQIGWGMGRRRNGASAVRLLDALCAVSGNLGIPGGGASFYTKRRGAFDTSFIPSRPPRQLSEPRLGRAILEAADPPVRVVFVTAGNPVAMLPESETVAHALRTRELTVVVDPFLTDTARCADVVLPTTTMLEEDDLVGAYGHHWIGAVNRAVAPPPEVLTDLEIAQELGRRTGTPALEGGVDTWRRRLLGRVAPHGLTLERLAEGAARSPLAPQVLFADGRVPTATGRVNLIDAVDATPPATTEERPLLLLAVSTEKTQSSQCDPRLQEGPATVTVHPEGAAGLPDGAAARLESAIGSLVVQVRHDPRQRRDVALMAKGGWHHRGRSANALVPAELTDDGEGAAYYDTPVRLLPLDP